MSEELEISKIEWTEYESAMATLQFDSFKNILAQAHDFLSKRN